MIQSFDFWYDGVPASANDPSFSFDTWYDGAPVPFLLEHNQYTLTAETGVFVLTGYAAGLTVTRNLTAETGVFLLTGYDAGLIVATDYVLTADTGAFLLTGYDVALTPSVTPVPPVPPPVSGGLGGLTGGGRRRRSYRIPSEPPRERAEAAAKVGEPSAPPMSVDEFLFTRVAAFTITAGNTLLVPGGEDEDLAAIMLLMFDEEFDWPDVTQFGERNKLTHHGAKW